MPAWAGDWAALVHWGGIWAVGRGRVGRWLIGPMAAGFRGRY